MEALQQQLEQQEKAFSAFAQEVSIEVDRMNKVVAPDFVLPTFGTPATPAKLGNDEAAGNVHSDTKRPPLNPGKEECVGWMRPVATY